jgi:hypothetical protein
MVMVMTKRHMDDEVISIGSLIVGAQEAGKSKRQTAARGRQVQEKGCRCKAYRLV